MPVMDIVRAAVEIALFAALSREVMRLRARGQRRDRDVMELSRTVATVQGWAAQEFRALRSEFTVARVNDSAVEVMARRAEAREARAPSAASVAQLPALEDDPDEQRDTVAMPAPETLTAPHDDDDDDEDATSLFDREPPIYAARFLTLRSPALRPHLAHPDLIGCEDIADEADRAYLAPDETTPPRRGRAALLVPTFRGPEHGGAA